MTTCRSMRGTGLTTTRTVWASTSTRMMTMRRLRLSMRIPIRSGQTRRRPPAARCGGAASPSHPTTTGTECAMQSTTTWTGTAGTIPTRQSATAASPAPGHTEECGTALGTGPLLLSTPLPTAMTSSSPTTEYDSSPPTITTTPTMVCSSTMAAHTATL